MHHPTGQILAAHRSIVTFAIITLPTADLDGTFERLQAGGAGLVQEPTEQPYGVRDCAIRDPAGDLIRINQLS